MAYSLIEDIQQKKQKVKELGITISIYAEKPVSRAIKGQEQVLRDHLDAGLLELERQGLNLKIKAMEQLIGLLKGK